MIRERDRPVKQDDWRRQADKVFWEWLSENAEDVRDFHGLPDISSLYERLQGIKV